MPAKSKSQQRLFGMVHACQKYGKACSPEVSKIAGEISEKDADDFASTKHKGLPEKKKSFKEWVKDKQPQFKTIQRIPPPKIGSCTPPSPRTKIPKNRPTNNDTSKYKSNC